MSNTKAVTTNQKTLAVKNSIKILLWATIKRLFTAILLFVIMFLYIKKFSDEINGMIRSVSQIMLLFSIIDGGIGVAIIYKLYKPMFNKDWDVVNDIFSAANKFLKKIGWFYIILIIVNCCILPAIYINTTFKPLYIIALIGAVSSYSIFGYFISGKYYMILNSDQKNFVLNQIQLFWSLFFSIFTIGSFFWFPHTIWYTLIPLLFLAIGNVSGFYMISIYTKWKYPQLKIQKTNLKLGKLFGNSFAHKLCYTSIAYLDGLILSISSLKFKDSIFILISVYAAFASIGATIKSMFEDWLSSISYAIGQNLKLKKKISGIFFNFYEYFTVLIISFIFIMFTLISPFFINYFFGKNLPKEYFNIGMAILVSASIITYLLRIPYWTLITSYGHFRETRSQAIIELILNVVISLILVWFLKVYGVLIGTIVSSSYRFIAIRRYCLKNFIKEYSHWSFYKSISIFLIIASMTSGLLWFNVNHYDTINVQLISLIKVGVIAFVTYSLSIIILSLIFKYKDFMILLSQIKFLRKYDYFKNIHDKNIVNLH